MTVIKPHQPDKSWHTFNCNLLWHDRSELDWQLSPDRIVFGAALSFLTSSYVLQPSQKLCELTRCGTGRGEHVQGEIISPVFRCPTSNARIWISGKSPAPRPSVLQRTPDDSAQSKGLVRHRQMLTIKTSTDQFYIENCRGRRVTLTSVKSTTESF